MQAGGSNCRTCACLLVARSTRSTTWIAGRTVTMYPVSQIISSKSVAGRPVVAQHPGQEARHLSMSLSDTALVVAGFVSPGSQVAVFATVATRRTRSRPDVGHRRWCHNDHQHDADRPVGLSTTEQLPEDSLHSPLTRTRGRSCSRPHRRARWPTVCAPRRPSSRRRSHGQLRQPLPVISMPRWSSRTTQRTRRFTWGNGARLRSWAASEVVEAQPRRQGRGIRRGVGACGRPEGGGRFGRHAPGHQARHERHPGPSSG